MSKDKKKQKKNKKEFAKNSAPDWAKYPVEKEQPELEFKDFKW